MIIYLLAIMIIGLLFLIGRRNPKLNIAALVLSFIVLWLISGLKDQTVGTDTPSYVAYFEATVNGSAGIDTLFHDNIFTFSGFEKGFQILTYLISRLTTSYTIYSLILYSIVSISTLMLIKKNSSNYFLSTMIYMLLFYLPSLSAIRQSLAISIVLLGYNFIKERKLIKYVAVVLLATLMHQASIVMIVIYFMYNRTVNPKIIFRYVSIALISLFSVVPLIYFMSSVNVRYSFYIDRIGSYSLGSFLTLGLYLIIGMFCYVSFRKTRKKQQTEENALLVKTSLAGAAASIIALKVNALSRLSTEFMIYIIIAIPQFISNYPVRTRRHMTIATILLLTLYSLSILLLKPEWYNVTNYQFAQ